MSFGDMDGILEEFIVESQEQLAGVEAMLMALEVRRVAGEPLERAEVDTIFRAFHSVKGTAGFLDLDQIVNVTHEAETLLDKVRNDQLELNGEHVTALCAALDFASAALQEIESTGSDAALAAEAKQAVAFIAASQRPQAAEPEPEVDAASEPSSVFPLDDDVPAEASGPAEPVVDPTLDEDASEAPADLEHDRADDSVLAEDHQVHDEPASVVSEPASVVSEPRSVAKEEPAPSGGSSAATRAAPKAPPSRSESRPATGGSIRVDVEKLDTLMNLVGELILAETMVTHSEDLQGLELRHFTKAARDLNRITRALQDIAMSVRMVPIGATFQRMYRLVRDLSMKQGKRIDLVLLGEQTEIDKNLVERIGDPLVHMMRNAIDHGIEHPDVREAAGKSPSGTIHLEALHQSGEVWVVIRDDGKGLDREKIAAKAIERGLIDSDSGMSDSEVFELIFAPGFSTADAVSDVSGRGVGMDVVRRNIEEVSGHVEVKSVMGEGTTVTLKIPLTLAIIDGMLVESNSQIYILPLLAIKESLQGDPSLVSHLPDGGEVVNIRGQIIPLLRMRSVFDPRAERLAVKDGILVVCHHGGRAMCLLVDGLLGQRQTVIKGLPEYLGSHAGFSGCSILSNGDISLIIDLGHLRAKARSHRSGFNSKEAAA